MKFLSILSLRLSQWSRGLRRRSGAAGLLVSWVRIPSVAWKFFCREYCVLSGRGLCDELVTRPEESYRLWCVVVCDLETSRMRSHNQPAVTELNRRCITGCISYMPLTFRPRASCILGQAFH